MSTKLFVGGISWNTTNDTLRQAFEAFGQVTEAKVVTDRDTGRSRGFGFVTFVEANSAQEAIADMNGKELDGRAITVNVAEERQQRDRGGFDGGGYNQNRGRGGNQNKSNRNRW